MQKFTLSVNYIITKFKEHNLLKKKILNCISKTRGNRITNENDRIAEGDHFKLKFADKPYLQILMPYLLPHMYTVFETLEHDKAVLDHIWYQQYEYNDIHNWHQHRSTSWTNVYYLELPKDSPGTFLKNPATKEIIIPNVVEGDILTFPGLVWHCSPHNISNLKKSIIAFNVK